MIVNDQIRAAYTLRMRKLALVLFAFVAMPLFAQTPGGPPYRVGGDVKAPIVITRVEPVYPAEARANRVSGIVITEVVIDRTGVVRDAKVLKPLPYGLDQAALDAVKQWQFRPGTLHGEPVDTIFNLTVNFKLDAVEGAVHSHPTHSRPQLTTVILVRHAEKDSFPASDPALSDAGKRRAQTLARMFAATPITAIYTTPYTRTRDTAAPLAAAANVTPVEVTANDAYPREIVRKVQEQRGGTFVVVGHSNTTRDVLRAFGISDAPHIAESEYDNLFIVTFAPFTQPRLLKLRY